MAADLTGHDCKLALFAQNDSVLWYMDENLVETIHVDDSLGMMTCILFGTIDIGLAVDTDCLLMG